MIVDLDRFKEINDVHGHAAGDELLKATAARITALLSHTEFAARLGGDEFVIVQTGRDQPASAARLADKLLEVFSKPVLLAGQPFHVGLTIGVAVYPRDGDDTRKLLANADLALYRAKEHGRARACFFTPDMDETVRERRILAQQLTQAIENDELEVYYQAQASIATGEIIGFEALARWNHPTHGYISPSQFIPIAEETDLILHLGEWILRKVCKEAAHWTKPYTVAVNLSPIQFKLANLPELVHEILIETGMPPHRLELEITESALIEDLQRTLDMLRRIKALGVAIAMDDFGTGYSSLSTLQAFPFDKLKIDKSFVDKIGSRQQATVIVTAVLGLGRSLDIPVLAEGVENEEQRSFLDSEACAQAQGYLFGRPAPLADIRHLVYATEDSPTPPTPTKLRAAGRRGPAPGASRADGLTRLRCAASRASGCGTRSSGAWRSAASPSWRRRSPRRATDLAAQDAPRSRGRRSPSSPAGSGRGRARASASHLLERALPDHAVEALPRCGGGASRDPARARSARHPAPASGGAAAVFCQSPSGRPVASSTSSARRMRCGSLGRIARRGRRIALGKQRMEPVDALRLEPLRPARADLPRDLRDGGEAFRQRLEIEAGAAGDDRERAGASGFVQHALRRRRARRRPNSASPRGTWP